MSPFQILPAADLQTMLEKRVQWHDANMPKFIETWKEYVDPAGGGVPAAAAAAVPSGVDNTMPE